jgi:hypothetical protein
MDKKLEATQPSSVFGQPFSVSHQRFQSSDALHFETG